MLYIGIDLGGTGIKAGVVDDQGNILYKDSCPTGSERGYEAVIHDMANLALDIVQKGGPAQPEIVGCGSDIVQHSQSVGKNVFMPAPVYRFHTFEGGYLGEYTLQKSGLVHEVECHGRRGAHQHLVQFFRNPFF